MTRRRGRHAWEYPYDFEDDPAVAQDRRELDEGTGDPELGLERMARAYWQRYAEHVAAWLAANPGNPEKDRDNAEAYRIVTLRYAATSGALDIAPNHPDDLHALYLETHNPLYVWQATFQALEQEKPSSGIPDWCTQEVSRVAFGLITLGLSGELAATSANALKVLRLFSQGTSAYGQRTRRWRDQRKADLVAELTAGGMPLKRARAVAFPDITDSRTLRAYGNRIPPRIRPNESEPREVEGEGQSSPEPSSLRRPPSSQ